MKIKAPQHGNLEGWSRQGVLMLNTVLTVRKGDANSHQKKGYGVCVFFLLCGAWWLEFGSTFALFFAYL